MSAVTDLLLPFHIEAGLVRGRLVRLGPAVDAILGPHHYPLPVAALLAETVALAAVLAGTLKYQGVFTLQAQGKGPVTLLVADVTSEGALRGYARYDEAKLANLPEHSVPYLLGGGHLAFTVDQGADTDRYQGIVELIGRTLGECVELYFRQSEQLDTAVKTAVRPAANGHGWQASALMVQRMPAASSGAPILTGEEAEDGWRRAAILMFSATEAEMVGDEVSPDGLLWRLFHAESLMMAAPKPLAARCRCSTEKVLGTLRSFPADEVQAMEDEAGQVTVTCEFCKSAYAFDRKAIGAVATP